MPKGHLALRLLPTWECNLRCNHCCVLGLLKAKDDCEIRPEDVLKFCRAHKDRYGTTKFNLSFLGGECLLKARQCLEILDIVTHEFGEEAVHCSLTTNLSMDLDATHMALLCRCYVDVSLDGLEDQHNWQRKSLTKESNPFRKTFCNLARLMKLGMKERVTVQAAVQQKMYDNTKKIEFFRSLIKIGVKKILYGTCYPTQQNPDPDQIYLECLKNPRLVQKTCCDYRYMNLFTINSKNEIVGDYFGLYQAKPFNLKDFGFSYGMDDLEKAYKEKIRNGLNILHDKTCMDECPVVAYCWGGCQNSEFNAKEPSRYCSRDSLESLVRSMAEQGSLMATEKVSSCGGKS